MRCFFEIYKNYLSYQKITLPENISTESTNLAPGQIQIICCAFQKILIQRTVAIFNDGVGKSLIAPPQPFQHPNSSPREIAEPKAYPYVCFVETTGLLVVISYSGYCCKFSIEFEEETPVNDLRTKRYNNKKRIGSRSPIRHKVKLNLGSAEGPNNPLNKSGTPAQPNSSEIDLNNIITNSFSEVNTGISKGQNQIPIKQPGALSGFKEPILRLKFKINDFFSDKKAESQQRINRRLLFKQKEELRQELIRKYNMEQRLRQMSPQRKLDRTKSTSSTLPRLISTEMIKRKP